MPETGASLADKVSATLQQYGVSDEQRNAVLDQLKQIFAHAGTRAEARQNAQRLFDNFVQSLNPAPAEQPPGASPDAGQNIDFTA